MASASTRIPTVCRLHARPAVSDAIRSYPLLRRLGHRPVLATAEASLPRPSRSQQKSTGAVQAPDSGGSPAPSSDKAGSAVHASRNRKRPADVRGSPHDPTSWADGALSHSEHGGVAACYFRTQSHLLTCIQSVTVRFTRYVVNPEPLLRSI